MTIGTKHRTFIQLTFDFIPAPGIPLTGNTKIFLSRISMMKLKRFKATIVSAAFALAALIVHCHLADLFPPLVDSLYKVLFPIAVCAFVFLHKDCFEPLALARYAHSCTAACSTS